MYLRRRHDGTKVIVGLSIDVVPGSEETAPHKRNAYDEFSSQPALILTRF